MNNAALAQVEERRTCNAEVTRSKRVGSTITAHQPCLWPWLGFWAKLACADKFVIFDNVSFSRHDYANRVQIKTKDGPLWLTVPCSHGYLLSKTPIIGKRWAGKHLKTIEQAYGKARYFARYYPEIRKILQGEHEQLESICSASFSFGLRALGIAMPTTRASLHQFRGQKSSLVLDMCKQLGATKYIFGQKGKDYADVEAFKAAGIEPVFQQYRHPTYPQLHGPFIPGLSIIDLLFNCGPDSLEILNG